MVTIATTLMHKKATLRNVYAGETQREIFSISQTTLHTFFTFPYIPQVYFGIVSYDLADVVLETVQGEF